MHEVLKERDWNRHGTTDMAVNPLHEVEAAQEHPTPVGQTDGEADDAIDHGADCAPRSPIEAALQALIERYGPALLFESNHLASHLRERCPDAEREITVLLRALDVQVPQDLLSAHTDEDLQSLLPRLAKQLSDRKRLADEASTWAVRTWARGLGLAVFATGPLPEKLYADVVVSSVVVPPAEIRSTRMPAERRSKVSALGIVIATAVVALIAAGLASFHAPPLVSAPVARSEPPIDDGKKREELASAKSTPPVIAAIEAPRPIVPDVVRSEPRRALPDAAPQARVASRECTSATCGKVVDVRELGTDRRGKTYEVTVLTDNGTTHVLTQDTRWKKGARVRVIANTIAAING